MGVASLEAEIPLGGSFTSLQNNVTEITFNIWGLMMYAISDIYVNIW